MVTLFSDPRMLGHVPGPRHPERPERLAAVIRHLERTGLARHCPTPPVRAATDEELLRVHTPGHVAFVDESASGGPRQVEADTWVSPGSSLAGRLAAGAVVDAVTSVVQGPDRRALCLVRPPGHHARPDDVMGFLPVCKRRRRGGRRDRPTGARPGLDRGLGRPPWERDAGNLL